MIEFFFDCSSPWTYLAFHNIQLLAKEFNAQIVWRPILVGGIFNSINPSVYAAREQPIPAKAAYMKKGYCGLGTLRRSGHQNHANDFSNQQRQSNERMRLASAGKPRCHACLRPRSVRELLGTGRGYIKRRCSERNLFQNRGCS